MQRMLGGSDVGWKSSAGGGRPGARAWVWARRLLSVAGVAVALAWMLAGCGTQGSGVAAGGEGGPESLSQVFQRLAAQVAPMSVYGWQEPPAGIALCDRWLPALTDDEPDAYAGPEAENPKVSAQGDGTAEIEVVMAYQNGWLVAVDDFRGDLGDVTGEAVGAVDGHEAILYAVNGGHLVQWSTDSRWYGLFGRGVPADEVVALALAMRRVAGGAPAEK